MPDFKGLFTYVYCNPLGAYLRTLHSENRRFTHVCGTPPQVHQTCPIIPLPPSWVHSRWAIGAGRIPAPMSTHKHPPAPSAQAMGA